MWQVFVNVLLKLLIFTALKTNCDSISFPLLTHIYTNSIACSAKCWYINYPEGDFEFFHPSEATLHR